jgi:hypothetical protein
MKRLSLTLILAVVLLTVLVGLLTQVVSHAYTAKAYLSPSRATLSRNATLTVEVRIDSGGELVNATQVSLVYPADKLELVGAVDYAGSVFEISAEETIGSGSVHLVRGTTQPKKGNLLFAKLVFRARFGVGKPTISILKAKTFIVRSTDNQNILGTTVGTKITLRNR